MFYFPTKKENQNKYYPKIQIKRHFISKYFTESFLLIEFSIPKLIYLNNYYEVDFEDFIEICTTLQQRLQENGIIISINDIFKASVIQVHYSKNINITNYENAMLQNSNPICEIIQMVVQVYLLKTRV